MAAKAKLKAVLLLCLLSHPSTGLEKPNSVGRVPALGWNSWNAYGCNINSSSFLTAANALLSTGLKDAGYIYVNIDDCWSMKDGRDDQTHQLIPNATRFPDGIKGVADEVHDLGLRLGIYSSAGTETCGGYPASIGYESIDAATWAAWGVDYLKYDVSSSVFLPLTDVNQNRLTQPLLAELQRANELVRYMCGVHSGFRRPVWLQRQNCQRLLSQHN